MLGTNFWKSLYCSIFATYFVFSQNFENFEFVKFSKIISLFVIFFIISHLVKIMVNLDVFSNCRKITIFLKFMKDLKSVRNSWKKSTLDFYFEKSQCLSKSSKLFILVKTLNKTSILVKIFVYLNFGQDKGHFDFRQTILKITIKSNLVKIFGKSWLQSKFLKVSISVKKIANRVFGQNSLSRLKPLP